MALVVAYNMQETSGTTISDSGGTGKHATYQSANISAKTVAGPGGVYARAIRFAGGTDRAETSASIDLSGGQIASVAYWLYVDSIVNYAAVYEFGDTTNSLVTGGFITQLRSDSPNTENTLKNSTAQNSARFAVTRPGWQHCVDIYDKSQVGTNAGEVDKYKNAVLLSKEATSSVNSTDTLGSYPLYFAGKGLWTCGSVRLAGFKIYNHRLSQSEISELFAEYLDSQAANYTGVTYTVPDWRPHYATEDKRPNYTVPNYRPNYTGG